MNGLDERIHDLLKDAERSESKEETIHMLAEEIGRQIVKILIETGLLIQIYKRRDGDSRLFFKRKDSIC